MFKLRPYQLKAVEFCTQKLAERKNSLLVAATGAGKTIMLSAVAQWICRQGTGKVYVVVGRDKINQQNIEKFRKVVPEYPVSEFSGRMKSTHGRVIFLTVQTAIGHYMKLPRPMAVIFDECFVKGTKIATPFGEKNIEKIKVGDKVFCFNEKSKKIEIKKVGKTYKKTATSIMRLRFGTQMILCTPNHPFYTKRGWTQAKDLKENDYVLQLVQKGNRKFDEATKGLCARKRLLLLLQRLWARSISEKIIRNNGKNESKICIRSNARTQSYETSRNTKKSIGFFKKNWASTENTGRGRERLNNPTRKVITSTWGWMDARIPCCNSKLENPEHTYVLQDRYRKSEFKNSNRNRRAKSFIVSSERARPEKNTRLEWVRVDSIKILESGSHGKFVYNFAVNKHHNYFANGILVHNCHHARADSYEALLKFWKPDMVFGATATPERGDGKSLGSLFDNFYQISARQLIDMNYLSKPEFYNFNAVCEIPRDADKATRNTYIAAISSDMANAFRELPRLPGKSIVFCRNHDIAGLVCTILTGVGEKVAYIKSGDSANESEMDRFLTGKAQWLVNVDIATEGFDDPYIMNVFNLCSDGTRGRWVQKIGRGLRPHQHKTICRVFDCGGNIDTYGDLDFTECLPVAAEKDKSGVLRILDLWRDNGESEKQIEMAMPEFNAGGTFTPYAAPDGWFSFYDPDYETVFLRNDGRFAKLPDGREVAIRQDATFELDDIELPKVESSNKGINSWQLGQLTDIPTFGLEKTQADAVLAWKSWKSKQRNKKTNA